MALEAPPTWKEIEGDSEFQSLPQDQKRSTLEKWNDYSKTYAQEQGWDQDEEFNKTYSDWYSKEAKKYQAPVLDRVLQTTGDVVKSVAQGVSDAYMGGSEGLYRAAGSTVAPFDRDEYLNQEAQSAQAEIDKLSQNTMMIPEAREAGIRGEQERLRTSQEELRARQTEGTPEFQQRAEQQNAQAASFGTTLLDIADEAGRLREGARQALPVSKEFEASLPGQIAQGLGQLSTIPLYAIPGVGPTVSIGQLYQEGYDDAIRSGASPTQARDAAAQYTAIAAPMDIITDKLIVGRALKGMVGKTTVKEALKDIGSIAIKEGAAEGGQQAALNLVASQLSGYDPDRPLTQDVLNSVLVGSIVGGAGAGVAQVAGSASRPKQEANEAGAVIAENAAAQTEVLLNNNAPQTAQAVAENAEQAINAVDRQSRTLEILEGLERETQPNARNKIEFVRDLDPETPGLQTEPQGDERFAPPATLTQPEITPEERSKIIRKASSDALNELNNDPDLGGQSSLREWRETLPTEIASNFQAHGASIKAIEDILENGIDASRPFYTADLTDGLNQGGTKLGLRDYGTGGQVLVLGAPGQDIKQSGVQAVVVNDYLAPSVPKLQEAYPNVTWLTTKNATQWLNEQQSTRLDEPITIPQGQAQAPQAGVAPEVQESPVTKTQGERLPISDVAEFEVLPPESQQADPIRNFKFSQITPPENTEQWLALREERKNAEITLLQEEIGITREQAEKIHDIAFVSGRNSDPWASKNLDPQQRERYEAFFDSDYNQKGGPVDFWEYSEGNRFDPSEIQSSNSKKELGEDIVRAFTNTVTPGLNDKWIYAVSAIKRLSDIGGTRKDISDALAKQSGRMAGSQSDAEFWYSDRGKQINDVIEAFAPNLPISPNQPKISQPRLKNAIQVQSPAEGVLRPEIQEPQQQVELQGVQQGNELQQAPQEGEEIQVNETARTDSGAIPEAIQPNVPAVSEEPSLPASQGPQLQRVQIGSSPQTHQVIEELPQSQREQELGERYFRIRNERTGEEQTVEAGDMRPVKGKIVEDAIKPEVDQTKERLNTLTPSQKESVLSLNNNSGSVLIPDFQDLQQAVQNIASSLNQAYDNFTDWSSAMVRSFGNDIIRFLQRIYRMLNTGGINYIENRDNQASILNPAGMFSKSTRKPFRKVQKDKKYKPEGIWSAAGKWNKQIFDFLGQKERNVSANLNATEFLASKLQRERRKAEKEGINISTETLNTALGNTDNRLTDAQYEEARKIRNEDERLSFELTAKLENLQRAREAQTLALQSLPPEMQDTINEMRNRVDQLSTELKDSGAVSGDIQASIDDAMGLYLHRSYSIFDNAEGWKNFIYSDDPEAVAIRNRAEALLQDYARADAARRLLAKNREAGTPITRQQAVDQVKDLDVTEEAGLLLEDYLSVADKGEQSILGGRLPGQKNQSIIKMRGQIPDEIRELWGEQKDATANFAKTYAGMSSFLENHRFLQNVLQEGLITDQNPDGYIWKEGESPGIRPRAYIQLVGDGSKSMEPLNGAWMPPELAQAFTEYYGKRGDQNALLRILQAATGLSMKSKTAYSLASTIRNFVGNIAFMTANGNFNISKLSDAQKSAWSNLTKGGDKAIRDRIENYIRLGVVGDNVGPSLIKEITEAANIEKTGDKLTQGNPILTKIWRGLKAVDRKATDIYSSVDDFWKVFAFENELNKIKRAYPNETQAQQEQRAADVVRATVPTYSLAPEIVRNMKSNFGVAVAPFITFTTEVVRTTYNTVRQGVTEIREGSATNNKALRDIGIQRLASFVATQSIFPALGIIFKELFDYDDEDEDAVRKFLPDWQKNAQLLLLPPDDKGNPRYIDVSFLDPYGYLKEPIIAALVQSRSGKSTDQIALDASLASLRQIAEPFISEQILAGSIADIARNTTASGAEVYNPQDNIANIAGKAVMHVLSSFEPGTYTSLSRIYKGITEQVSPTGRAYDTPSELSSLLLGQRVSSLDPQTSLDFASRRFKSENQDSTSLFTQPFKNRGTIGENDVAEGYRAANEAKQRNVQSLRDAYKAAMTLGVSEKEAKRILDDASIGKDAMREVISGVYRRYQPSIQSLNEVRKKNPERIRQLQEAISETPETIPLR